jgi:hypothetical protein
MQEEMDGWFVGDDGSMMTCHVERTVNPQIVRAGKALGDVVVGVQFFEDEDEARDQAKENAQAKIEECEAILDNLSSRRKKNTKSGGWFSRGKDTSGSRSTQKDPLGPPKFGVSKTLEHRKLGYQYKINGFNNETDDGEIIYICSRIGGKGTLRLTRDQIDANYEVVE